MRPGWRAVAHVVYPTSAASLSVTLTAFVALSREVELAVGSMRMLGLLGVLHVWNVVATAVVGYVLAVNPFHPLPQVGAGGFLGRSHRPSPVQMSQALQTIPTATPKASTTQRDDSS